MTNEQANKSESLTKLREMLATPQGTGADEIPEETEDGDEVLTLILAGRCFVLQRCAIAAIEKELSSALRELQSLRAKLAEINKLSDGGIEAMDFPADLMHAKNLFKRIGKLSSVAGG